MKRAFEISNKFLIVLAVEEVKRPVLSSRFVTL
eukprot:COSAG05_NODE_15656_length_364_cov_0.966038_1_plen_32_part_10